MNFGIYHIPKEIVGEIISHVKTPVDLVHLMRVSRLFREFAKPKIDTKTKKFCTKLSNLVNDACREGISYMIPFIEKLFTLTEKNRWILKIEPQFRKDILSIIPEFKTAPRGSPEVRIMSEFNDNFNNFLRNFKIYFSYLGNVGSNI
uniref:F-box-like protein n=1 Tax=Marseillevirus LCMAC102 TaxID=2506603 RepID=A0A481YT71_9VIRU|nr:MAG: F-box-like protein [Marseillevirus LCMAC102]